jgi:hypothetical protein
MTRWVAMPGQRNPWLTLALLVGESTTVVANRHGLSAGRGSRWRRHFRKSRPRSVVSLAPLANAVSGPCGEQRPGVVAGRSWPGFSGAPGGAVLVSTHDRPQQGGGLYLEDVLLNAASNASNALPADNAWQAPFLALLPKLHTHAQIYFRNIQCPDKKADKVAEMVALAWRWYIRLCEKGKDITTFSMVFIYLAAKAVKSGRRITGQEKSRDVLSPLAQQRHNFVVASLPTSTRVAHESLYGEPQGQKKQDSYEELLQDNLVTPIPDQVQFRIDFPAWLATLTGRERRLIRAMARNERTSDLSKEFELSPGRISQLRKEFQQGWRRYIGEGVA